MRCAALALVLLATVACGDNSPAPGDGGTPDGPTIVVDHDLLDKLRALPGVTAEPAPTSTAGYTYIVLHFTQPVDHDDPSSATFQQEVSLIDNGNQAAPMIVETDGYWDYTLDGATELTDLLGANQISIEHRFFTPSRPDPTDWTKDTIAQMAADEHAIVTALKTIYTGPHIATGASKGGMTSVYYRRFFPDDVVGTVPYVAPLSFAAPDTRYDAFFTDIGPADGACRQAIRDAATEMLQHRRAALVQRATAQATTNHYSFTRISIGAAVESSVASLEWAFWQYYGANVCGQIPAVTDSDDAMFDFLDQIAPVGQSDDDYVAAFEPYYFQAEFQLGYPDTPISYLTPYLQFADTDYNGVIPEGSAPIYDGGTAMHDVDGFVQTSGTNLLFIYGQWDPWSGGKFTLGDATGSALFVQPEGTHGSDIADLASADHDAAISMLAAWTGVTPDVAPAKKHVRAKAPHVPPAMLRAIHRL